MYSTPAVQVARGIAQILVTRLPSALAVRIVTVLSGLSSLRLAVAAVVTP
jgi:hypothetical protein